MKDFTQGITDTCQSDTESLKTAIGADAVDIQITPKGFVVNVVRKDSQLDSLLMRPNETRVPASTRTTATGTVNVRGYTRKNNKPSLTELLEANEADEKSSVNVSKSVRDWVYTHIQNATANISSGKL